MNIMFSITVVTHILVSGALAQDETLIEGHLPKVSKEWVRRDDAGEGSPYSWVNFDHIKRPGEVLSFVLWNVSSEIDVTAAPVSQASIETFRSNGSARFATSERGRPIADTLRHRVVIIDLQANGLKHEVKALEYTYLYEGVGSTAETMAHGYCIAYEGKVLFVQHTSNGPITSELAFEMAAGLIARHLKLAGKPHSFGRGRVVQTND